LKHLSNNVKIESNEIIAVTASELIIKILIFCTVRLESCT